MRGRRGVAGGLQFVEGVGHSHTLRLQGIGRQGEGEEEQLKEQQPFPMVEMGDMLMLVSQVIMIHRYNQLPMETIMVEEVGEVEVKEVGEAEGGEGGEEQVDNKQWLGCNRAEQPGFDQQIRRSSIGFTSKNPDTQHHPPPCTMVRITDQRE